MTVKSLTNGPEIVFCCSGAKAAWDADAIVIVPEPHEDGEPLVFAVALSYEGGPALRIGYCPFCATPVTVSEPTIV